MPPAGNPKRTMSTNLKGVSEVMPSGSRSMGGLSDVENDREDSTLLSGNLAADDVIRWPTPARPTATVCDRVNLGHPPNGS
jgi:hypothetical protein